MKHNLPFAFGKTKPSEYIKDSIREKTSMSSNYTLKTRPTNKDPLQIINAITNKNKQADAMILLRLFEKATGQPPVVWGAKFIGYGSYEYRCASGYDAEIYATGFSVTNRVITLHLYLDEPELQNYLQRLGKTTSGKSCIYINKLADIDKNILEEMLNRSCPCQLRVPL